MRIAYGKLGCSTHLEAASNLKGDLEVRNLLLRLLAAGHTIDLVSKHRGPLPPGVRSQWDDTGAFRGVIGLSSTERADLCDHGVESSPRYVEYAAEVARAVRELPDYDAWVIWLGEHNGPCWPLPLKNSPTGYCRPYVSRINYAWPLVAALNYRHVVPIWLCPDPRNVLRCDNLDPQLIGRRPILAQYDETNRNSRYLYAGIELLAIDHALVDTVTPHAARRPYGAMLNEGSKDSRPLGRRNLARPWILDLQGEMVGAWRPETIAEMGIEQPRVITAAEIPKVVGGWASTIALPINASGWATAKPWEAFALGTVCFAHPAYDDQDHVYDWIRDADLRRFLRPPDPATLAKRVAAVARSEILWRELSKAQRAALTGACRCYGNGAALVLEDLLTPNWK